MNLTREFIGLALPTGILLLPVVVLLLRYFTLHGAEKDRTHIWLNFLSANHVLSLAGLLVWCTFWDIHPGPNKPWFLFWMAPLTSTIMAQMISRVINRSIFQRSWTATDLVRQAWWSTVHPSVTLLMVATGFHGIFGRRLFSILWLLAAGIVAVVGTIHLRSALGLKLRRVKSGTLYVRAMYLAKKMGCKIERICVVPPGKGHLTNAFGSSRTIALTDNFGEYLHGPQLDYVISHELVHGKNKHTRKEFTAIAALLSLLAVSSFIFASLVPRYQLLLMPIVLVVPLLTYYAISRKFEYEADRDAVRFTSNPEAGMRALAALYVKTDAPIERGRFLELFATHPNLLRRISAIARAGQVPQTRVSEILFESGILKRDSPSRTSAAEA